MPAAGVLYETDAYRERAPAAALRAAIVCMWARRGDGTPVRVLPDGCTDIIWRTGAGAIVAGPDTRAAPAPTRADELIVGVRLRPGAGGAAYRLSLAEIRDRRVALSALGLDPHEELHGELDPRAALAGVSPLAARLTIARPPDLAVQAAVARLADPRQRIHELAADLGLSEVVP